MTDEQLIAGTARLMSIVSVGIICLLLLVALGVLASRHPSVLETMQRSAVFLAVMAVIVGASAWVFAAIAPGSVGLSVMLWGPLGGLIGGAIIAFAAGRRLAR